MLLKLLQNFNTTMVRLKDRKSKAYVYEQIKFQYHYGTIKSITIFIFRKPPTKFQYHYGTIKSYTWPSQNNSQDRFQYHYGTIKRIGTPPTVTTYNLFQYHYGTIKRVFYYRVLCSFFAISIPLWYD